MTWVETERERANESGFGLGKLGKLGGEFRLFGVFFPWSYEMIRFLLSLLGGWRAAG